MGKVIKLALIGIIAIVTYKHFNTKEQVDGQNWLQYQFDSDNVVVKFPDKPKVENISVENLQIEMVRLRRENVEYGISVFRGESILHAQSGPASLIKKGAELISSNNIFVMDYLGDEYHLIYKGRNVTQRFIHLDDSLVSQIVFFGEGDIPKKSAQLFLGSLEVL
ncbi:hypothetical protein L2737_14565 [Shewanella electrodiphila]|uniref:Uncharacterized protein n=1 Tax=Shewanella electrodiphila TaxID=934143 RepID=A0ABT0KRX0_9GAMM|nr:hypothetical protein [Shewanella electrodiphila]MCL1046534.1 hypothetical protein [Shewanella electrodiphila]